MDKQNDFAQKKRPRRYKLYDRLNISLKTLDVIIWSLIATVVLALVWGIIAK